MREHLRRQAEAYCVAKNLTLVKELGYGFDGSVWSTDRPSAIKAFEKELLFLRERGIYMRLSERGIRSTVGFAIPKLIDLDNQLLVIEMEFVSPPFIVDFAGAYLDQEPPWYRDHEIRTEWEQDRRELFGDDWPTVRRAMYSLQAHGIYLNDVKPGNVTCR